MILSLVKLFSVKFVIFIFNIYRDPDDPESGKTILCEVCGKGFLTVSALRLHRLSHTGADLKCPDCDYNTKYKHAMESHCMRRHGKTLAGLPVSYIL